MKKKPKFVDVTNFFTSLKKNPVFQEPPDFATSEQTSDESLLDELNKFIKENAPQFSDENSGDDSEGKAVTKQ